MDRRSLQTGIWLIGLGLLFLTGQIWPGILILIGVSMIAETLLYSTRSSRSPEQVQERDQHQELASGEEEPIPPPLGAAYNPPAPTHDASRLPDVCPMCGGPVLSLETELEWTGFDSAKCPYCQTILPLVVPIGSNES